MAELDRTAPFSYVKVRNRLLLRYCDVWPQFFNCAEYMAWQDGKPWHLVVYSAPQCGKSTLAAAVAKDLQQRFSSPSYAVVTVFLNRASDQGHRIPDIDRPTRSLLLLALLRQFSEQPLHGADLLPRLASKPGAASCEGFHAHLEELVIEFLPLFERVFFIIDAVDQVAPEDFVAIESTFSWLAARGVSILVTRNFRALPSVKKRCNDCGQGGLSLYWRCKGCTDETYDMCYSCYDKGRHQTHCKSLSHDMHEEYRELEVELKAMPDGLATYITSQIHQRLAGSFREKRLRRSRDSLESLEQRVKDISNGMLVISKIYIDHLMDHRNIDELLYPQQAILKSEAAFFDSLLDRLYNSAGNDWEWAATLVPMVAQARTDLLTFDELLDALFLHTDGDLGNFGTLSRKELLRACRGLLCLSAPPTSALQLFHTDFATYIREKGYTLRGSPSIGLAQLCIRAFELLPTVPILGRDVVTIVNALVASHPFLRYAAHSWADLVSLTDFLDSMSKQLQNTNTRAACCWVAYSTSNLSPTLFDVPPGSTALHLYAHFGLTRALQAMKEDVLNTREAIHGRTPLIIAARNGHAGMVQALLELGADHMQQCWRHRTALLEAVANGHKGIVYMLLEHSTKLYPSTTQQESGLPLVLAIKSGDSELALRLASHPAIDVNSCDTEGLTPLMAAILHRQQTLVKALLERTDLRVEARNERGMTATHLAARRSDYNTLDAILANCSLRGEFGVMNGVSTVEPEQTPLMLLLSSPTAKDALTLRFLGRISSLFPLSTVTDARGRTLMHFAVEGNSVSSIDFLADQGLDLNAQDKLGWTPLHIACCLRRKAAVTRLVDLGARVTIADVFGRCAVDYLLLYHKQGSPAIASLLENHGSNGSSLVERPLWSQIKTGQLVTTVIRAASSEQDPFYGNSALHWAVQAKDLDTVVDVMNPASLDVLNFQDQTALHIAVADNDFRLIALMLEKGANVDHAPGRKSALGLAQQLGFTDVSLLLFEYSRNPVEPHAGLDQLFLAAIEKKKTSVARKLLKAGANILRHDPQGRLATQLAVEVGVDSETVEYLQREQAAELMRIWPRDDGLTSDQGVQANTWRRQLP